MKCAAFLNDMLPMTVLPVTSVSAHCGLYERRPLTMNQTFDLFMISFLGDLEEMSWLKGQFAQNTKNEKTFSVPWWYSDSVQDSCAEVLRCPSLRFLLIQ